MPVTRLASRIILNKAVTICYIALCLARCTMPICALCI